MWRALTEAIEPTGVTRYTILSDDEILSYDHVARAWRDDASFRKFFSDTLAAASYPAFFWETRPVTFATRGEAFEFVLVDSPKLSGIQADPRPFARVFATAASGQEIVSFSNIGHDALLIAPRPLAEAEFYPHLAAFVRGAPPGQQQALWAAVGGALAERIGNDPLWLSTSGLGVSWLHIRLDSAPKYYTYRPYRGPVRREDA